MSDIVVIFSALALSLESDLEGLLYDRRSAKLTRPRLRLDYSLFNHNYPVGKLKCHREIVHYGNYALTAPRKVTQKLHQAELMLYIEIGGRLIEENVVRVLRKSHSDIGILTHTPRQSIASTAISLSRFV